MIWVWIWAVVFILTVIIEIETVELASIWFSFGSFVSFILALCGANYKVQIIVFLIISVILFLFLRKICMKFLKNSNEKTNIDSIIGSVHVLVKEITQESPGEIKINSIIWRAVSKNNEPLPKDCKVKILEVNGNKFVVEKGEENNG